MTYADRTDAVTRLIEAGLDSQAARQGASQGAARQLTRMSDPNRGTIDGLTQLGHLGPLLARVVRGITPDQLDRPTPCTEFTVRGVLEHLINEARAFAAAYRGETAAQLDLSDVLTGFGPALEELSGAITAPGALHQNIAAPFGQVSGDTFARYVVLDGLMHGWDMATATGQAYDPPDELVAAADSFARQTIDPLRDGHFAEAVEPAPDASPIERLAAYTGRRPLGTGEQQSTRRS